MRVQTHRKKKASLAIIAFQALAVICITFLPATAVCQAQPQVQKTTDLGWIAATMAKGDMIKFANGLSADHKQYHPHATRDCALLDPSFLINGGKFDPAGHAQDMDSDRKSCPICNPPKPPVPSIPQTQQKPVPAKPNKKQPNPLKSITQAPINPQLPSPASPRDIDRLHEELSQRDVKNRSGAKPGPETDEAIPTPGKQKNGNEKSSVGDALDGLNAAYGDKKGVDALTQVFGDLPANPKTGSTDGMNDLKQALGNSPSGEYSVSLKTKSELENAFYARHQLENPRTAKSQDDIKLEPLVPDTQGGILKGSAEDVLTGELGKKTFGDSYAPLFGWGLTAVEKALEYGDEAAKNQKLAEYEAYARALPKLDQDIAVLESRKARIEAAVKQIKENGGQLDQWASDKVPGTLFEIKNEIGALQKLKTEFSNNAQTAKDWLEAYVKRRGKPVKEYKPGSL